MHAAEESYIRVPSVVVNSAINLAIVHREEILSVFSHNQKGSSCFGVNESFLMKLSIISFRMPDGNLPVWYTRPTAVLSQMEPGQNAIDLASN